MNSLYQNKKNVVIWLLFFFSCLWSGNVISQTTIATDASFTGSTVIPPGTAGVITFVVQNTNTQFIKLQQVDCFAAANQTPTNTYSLWYSTTSLSGSATIASPAWTLIKTGDPIAAPSADGIVTVLTNLDFTIPSGAQYRFALQASNGIRYSPATATPNTFTSNGVSLKVGNAQINSGNVGAGGSFPNAISNPRFFTGRIVFTQCAQPTLPTLTPDTFVCVGNTSATLRVTGGALNDALEWNWYRGSCGGTVIGTGTSITVSPNTTTTYYARAEGGCATSPGACSNVIVSVNPLPGVPTINPVTAICNNSVQTLSINPIAITEGNVTVSSGPISIAVPDETANGVTSTLALPNIPAGAVLSNIEIRLSMEHTYPGDMIFNLKAPNGIVANLYKYNGGTFTGDDGDLVNAGWFNTAISSTATTSFSSVGTPYNYGTGPYQADLLNVPVPGPPVQNPAGYPSTANSLTALTTVLNGNWTLAMCDGGPLDFGTLTEWSITFNYTVSAPAFPAVWTPISTLYSDAAATVPYDGITPSFTVYAKPSVTTTYTAFSSNNGCSSTLPATVMVTVNNPVGIAAAGNPSAAEICEKGTASFVVATTGTPPSYQWQVDNGSGTFVNITDNSNYSGSTADTLVVKDAPASFGGYLYHCIVTSAAPCTKVDTTTAAQLTVNKTPAITLEVSPYYRLLPGLTTTIKANVDSSVTSYAWFKSGTLITTATSQSTAVTIDGLGSYKSTIIDANGCTVTSAEVVIKDSVSSKLFMYPNPNDGIFQVRYYSVAGNVLPRQLAIYDAKGALVLNQNYKIGKPYDHMDVDLSHLSSGVYIVHLLDHNANRLAYGKVVVR